MKFEEPEMLPNWQNIIQMQYAYSTRIPNGIETSYLSPHTLSPNQLFNQSEVHIMAFHIRSGGIDDLVWENWPKIGKYE